MVSGRRIDRPLPAVLPAAQSGPAARAGDGEVPARRRGTDHQDLQRAGAEPLHGVRQSRGSRSGRRRRWARRSPRPSRSSPNARCTSACNKVFDAGTGAMGSPQLATQWQFAESSTGPFFDEFVSLLNPSTTQTATATLTFHLPGGGTLTRSYTRLARAAPHRLSESRGADRSRPRRARRTPRSG